MVRPGDLGDWSAWLPVAQAAHVLGLGWIHPALDEPQQVVIGGGEKRAEARLPVPLLCSHTTYLSGTRPPVSRCRALTDPGRAQHSRAADRAARSGTDLSG